MVAGRYFADLLATGKLTLCERNYECLDGADALLVDAHFEVGWGNRLEFITG